jgi:hypothetical protein
VVGFAVVVSVCGLALAVAQAAPATAGDAEARRVVQTQASAVKTQFGSAQSCFWANSAPCLHSATYRLHSVVLGAKANVVALLRARHLSTRVRSGVERYIAALQHEVWASWELYQAAMSLHISRINSALGSMRYWIAVADRGMWLIYS